MIADVHVHSPISLHCLCSIIMAAPAFEDVPPLRSIDSALLEAIRAQRELYLPAQRSANDLCRLKRGSARHQFMAESRERMLATLHRHS